MFQFTEHTKPKALFTFDNYTNSQKEIELLKQLIHQKEKACIVISGKKGSGVTHLLNAVCNDCKKQKTIYITAQWLLQLTKINKHPLQLKALLNQFLQQDVVAIDNIQLFYQKSKSSNQFFFDLMSAAISQQKLLVLGCSDDTKDITKSKALYSKYQFNRIDLKELGAVDVFKLLKKLCSPEDAIPDNLLQVISKFNGTVEEHINCLIAVRFKSKIIGISIDDLSEDELELKFNLAQYFPKQQFRKHLVQYKLDFNTNTQ